MICATGNSRCRRATNITKSVSISQEETILPEKKKQNTKRTSPSSPNITATGKFGKYLPILGRHRGFPFGFRDTLKQNQTGKEKQADKQNSQPLIR
jgi:hypothetical protein